MKKILIVEDDTSISSELKELIDNSGYNGVILKDFENSFEEIKKVNPNLILLDINIPKLNGEMLLQKIRKDSNVPIVMVTSKNTETDEVLSMSYGADDYITKPYNPITFGHPKMKMKWILPLPGVTIYSFEQFQPFFIYFDEEGISFFPLDLNNKYSIIGKSFISWKDLKAFNFKKGLIMEDEIILRLDNGKIEMKIPKAMNEWVKENNVYLIEHNHFYNK